MDDTASDERELIYHLLSSEGSLESQKVNIYFLLLFLDDVHYIPFVIYRHY